MKPQKGHKELRKARFSAPNAAYLITSCTYNRQPLLATERAAEIVIGALRWLAAKGVIELWGYVVMPDHVQAVIVLTSDEPLASVMQRFKSYTAHALNRLLGRRGPVWVPAYHEHGIRRVERLEDVVAYVEANPVRAGLVESAGDYTFSSASSNRCQDA